MIHQWMDCGILFSNTLMYYCRLLTLSTDLWADGLIIQPLTKKHDLVQPNTMLSAVEYWVCCPLWSSTLGNHHFQEECTSCSTSVCFEIVLFFGTSSADTT